MSLHDLVTLQNSDALMKALENEEILTNINSYDQQHRTTPLMLAIEANQFENVKMLLDAGADPNLPSISLLEISFETDFDHISSEDEYSRAVRYCGVNESIFHSAVKRGNLDIVAILVESGGANVNQKSSDGSTPLHTAVSSLSCGREIVEFLIRRGADIYAEDNFHRTPIQLALLSRLGCKDGEILVKMMVKWANFDPFEPD